MTKKVIESEVVTNHPEELTRRELIRQESSRQESARLELYVLMDQFHMLYNYIKLNPSVFGYMTPSNIRTLHLRAVKMQFLIREAIENHKSSYTNDFITFRDSIIIPIVEWLSFTDWAENSGVKLEQVTKEGIRHLWNEVGANKIFQNPDDFYSWLSSPNPGLGEATPMQKIETDSTTVENLIVGLLYGNLT